ncbi:hypothetical protein V8C44DRAFT_346588 [Trichoderma aethiopicum]
MLSRLSLENPVEIARHPDSGSAVRTLEVCTNHFVEFSYSDFRLFPELVLELADGGVRSTRLSRAMYVASDGQSYHPAEASFHQSAHWAARARQCHSLEWYLGPHAHAHSQACRSLCHLARCALHAQPSCEQETGDSTDCRGALYRLPGTIRRICRYQSRGTMNSST